MAAMNLLTKTNVCANNVLSKPSVWIPLNGVSTCSLCPARPPTLPSTLVCWLLTIASWALTCLTEDSKFHSSQTEPDPSFAHTVS